MRFFIIMVLVTVALAACGGGGDEPPEGEAKPDVGTNSVCLVKPSPPFQAPQPLPSQCAAK